MSSLFESLRNAFSASGRSAGDAAAQHSDGSESDGSFGAPVAYSDSESDGSGGESLVLVPRISSNGCSPCGRTFGNGVDLQQHLRDSIAYRTLLGNRWKGRSFVARGGLSAVASVPGVVQADRAATSPIRQPARRKHPKDYECDQCPRKFRSFPAVEQHRLLEHASERNHKCPFCNSHHASKSGESRSKVTREQIDQHVWRSTKGKTGATAAIVRHEEDPLKPITVFTATENCKNTADEYPCFFCLGTTFTHLKALNTHHNSHKHARRIPDFYACPKCGFDGQTSSGLMQHVQMARCGARKDAEVKEALEEMTGV